MSGCVSVGVTVLSLFISNPLGGQLLGDETHKMLENASRRIPNVLPTQAAYSTTGAFHTDSHEGRDTYPWLSNKNALIESSHIYYDNPTVIAI